MREPCQLWSRIPTLKNIWYNWWRIVDLLWISRTMLCGCFGPGVCILLYLLLSIIRGQFTWAKNTFLEDVPCCLVQVLSKNQKWFMPLTFFFHCGLTFFTLKREVYKRVKQKCYFPKNRKNLKLSYKGLDLQLLTFAHFTFALFLVCLFFTFALLLFF